MAGDKTTANEGATMFAWPYYSEEVGLGTCGKLVLHGVWLEGVEGSVLWSWVGGELLSGCRYCVKI